MTRLLRLLCLLILLQPVWADEPIQNAILISCDGLGRDVLQELLDAGKLPGFAEIIKAGSLQEIEVKGHATSTVPSHATMLTGCLPDIHGINDNRQIQPIPAGLTIFERIKKHFGDAGINTLMVAGKVKHLGGTRTNDVYWLARKGIDCFQSNDQLGMAVVRTALPVLERRTKPRFFLFIHFPDPDRAGHGYGKDSAQYRQAIVNCDLALRRVLGWLRDAQLEARTMIYISADHGFDNGDFTHSNAPHVFLATNDQAVRRGGVLPDVAATILARFGVDVAKLQPPLAGKSLVP